MAVDMALLEETKNIQERLGQYCKDGIEPNLPGTTPGRLSHYRRLVFNVIRSAISQAYPIFKSLVDVDVWESLVEEFFREHHCQNPQVWKLPLEFYEYAYEKQWATRLNKPYLNDLLYFEWMEIEVHTMPDGLVKYNENIDDWDTPIHLHPDYRLISLEYPVHMMQAEESIAKKGNYFVLVYRESDSGKVIFMNLSPLFVYLLEGIAGGNSLETIVTEVKNVFGISNETELRQHIQHFIVDSKNRGLVPCKG